MISREENMSYTDTIKRLREEIECHIFGKREQIELALLAAITEGHLLIEDVPGVGKTTLARALAQTLGGDFQRVQCTADLLPSDLTGVNIYHPGKGEFLFQEGPVFTHVLLADELNRATPKAQSSLLEAMEERQVTSDRDTRPLPYPFWVIATQNPLSFSGTFKLPESQLDRFSVSMSLGYLNSENERTVLMNGARSLAHNPIVSEPNQALHQAKLNDWKTLIVARKNIEVSPDLIDYMVDFAKQTREAPELRLGVSTRGVLSWLKLCQAKALIQGRHFVTPDDVLELSVPALAHRVWLHRQDSDRSSRVNYLETVSAKLPIPR
jgi:MoxR-like ATPase